MNWETKADIGQETIRKNTCASCRQSTQISIIIVIKFSYDNGFNYHIKFTLSTVLIEKVQSIKLNVIDRSSIGKELIPEIKTDQGVSQGCTISPTLFIIYTVDLAR